MADGNFEAALLTSTITQASVREVIKHKITPDFFEGARERSAFVWLMDWYRNPKYADTPSWEIFMDTWPDFEPEESSDSVAALCDKVRERKLFSDLAASLQQVALVGQGDPHAGLSEFRKHAAKLSATHTVDSSVTLADHISTIRAEYIRMATMEPGEQKLKGRPYPWPALNEATLGCQDGQLIVIYGRPKCVPLDEPVLRADGGFSSIADVPNVFGLDVGSQKLRVFDVEHHMEVVEKDVYEIETTSGYRVRVGSTHPMLRPDLSWQAAGDLKAGDYVGVVRGLQVGSGEDPLPPEQAELLGLLVGDGNYTRSEVQFTNGDRGIVDRLGKLITPFGCHMTLGAREIEFRVVGDVLGVNPILNWLRTLGVWGKKGREKDVPGAVYTSGTAGAVAFLGGLLSADGSVSHNAVMWSTSSAAMVRGIKHLLLRLGVVGTITEFETYTGPAWRVSVTALEQHEKLLVLLPHVSSAQKREKLVALVGRDVRGKRNNDGIPWSQELEDAILAARPADGSWPGMWDGFSVGKLFRRSGVISRALLRALAASLEAPKLLVWAESDVRWERIVTTRNTGSAPCADIQVGGSHNFVVGDFITHNSYKTWTALRAVVEFALNGARPLIYSQELSDLEMARRYVALLSRVDYTAFQKGLLDEQTSHDFLEDLEAFVEQSTVTFDYLSCSPAEVGIQIGAKIDETGSNVVLIDGAHTLGRGDWKELSVLTQELKKTAKMKNVPIIVTTHANRKKTEGGGTGDDMAHSDSFYQDCDVALRVKLSLENRRSREAMIETAAIREGAPCAFIVNTLLASNMEQKRVVQMTENDEGGEGAGDGAADARE